MSEILFNAELCCRDGICAQVCPSGYIQGKPGAFPILVDTAFCLQCGQCVSFCPHGAVRLKSVDAPAEEFSRDALPAPEKAELLFKSRRSIRKYTDEVVPRGVINELLGLAAYAPSGGNRRKMRIVIVYERKSMHALGDCIAVCMEENDGNAGAVFYPEPAKIAAAWRQGQDMLFRGAPHLAVAVMPKAWRWAAVDAAGYLAYLELAAHARGIGACWAGYITLAAATFAPVRAFLGIQEDEYMAGGQMLGYSSLAMRAVPPRAAYPAVFI